MLYTNERSCQLASSILRPLAIPIVMQATSRMMLLSIRATVSKEVLDKENEIEDPKGNASKMVTVKLTRGKALEVSPRLRSMIRLTLYELPVCKPDVFTTGHCPNDRTTRYANGSIGECAISTLLSIAGVPFSTEDKPYLHNSRSQRRHTRRRGHGRER